MRRIGEWYIWAGLVWLVVAMVFGIWLGIAGEFEFAESHAHMGLVGFAVSLAFGLMHGQYPAISESRLAPWQFWIYEIGAIVLVAGKMVIDGGGSDTLVKIGSIVVVVGTLLMLWLFGARRRS